MPWVLRVLNFMLHTLYHLSFYNISDKQYVCHSFNMFLLNIFIDLTMPQTLLSSSLAHHGNSLLHFSVLPCPPPQQVCRHLPLLNTQFLTQPHGIKLTCLAHKYRSDLFHLSRSRPASLLPLLWDTMHILFPQAAPWAVNGLLTALPAHGHPQPSWFFFWIFSSDLTSLVTFPSMKPPLTSPNDC